MPSLAPIDAEFLVLTTESGRALLSEAAQTPDPRPSDLARWRKGHPAEVVSAALRLSAAQRRAQAKFSRASEMWLEPTGLEQSTAEPVARDKAARFAAAPLAVDLCCGIGSDALAIAAYTPVLAVDLSPGMGRRTLWNARIHNVPHPLLALQARAERFPLPPAPLSTSTPTAEPAKAPEPAPLPTMPPVLNSFMPSQSSHPPEPSNSAPPATSTPIFPTIISKSKSSPSRERPGKPPSGSARSPRRIEGPPRSPPAPPFPIETFPSLPFSRFPLSRAGFSILIPPSLARDCSPAWPSHSDSPPWPPA